MKKLYLTATFTMIPELVDEFTSWMKNDYFKKMGNHGEFKSVGGVTVDMTDPLKKVCYRIELRGEESLRAHQSYYAGALDAYFSEKWAVPMQQGNLTAMVVVGEEVEFQI